MGEALPMTFVMAGRGAGRGTLRQARTGALGDRKVRHEIVFIVFSLCVPRQNVKLHKHQARFCTIARMCASAAAACSVFRTPISIPQVKRSPGPRESTWPLALAAW